MKDQETITIDLKSKIVTLKLNPLQDELDADNLTEIQHHNIIGEILVAPTILNRVGLLLADMEAITKRKKFDIDILEAKLREEKKKSLSYEDKDAKGNVKIVKPTIPEIEAAIYCNNDYQEARIALIENEKHLEYIKALYWAVKDKADKLNKLSQHISPQDFEKEVLESNINNIIIKVHNKLIK